MLSEEKIKEISEQMPDGFLWSEGCGWETGILIQEAIDFTRAIEAECEKVPEGYVLVPKSPNWFFTFLKEWDHFKGMGNIWAEKFYEQLIAAAPKPAQASPLDLMECLQDRPVEPSKAVQGKCVVQAEKQEPYKRGMTLQECAVPEVIGLYEKALKASWPNGATGDAFDYWNKARYLLAATTQLAPKKRGE